MFTKEGRLTVLSELQNWFVLGSITWTEAKLCLVTDDIVQSEDWTSADSGAWGQITVATNAATPWTTPAAVLGGIPVLSGATLTWTNTTGSTVTLYGWFVHFKNGGLGTKLMNYRRFDAPVVVAAGQQYRWVPGWGAPLPP